MEKDIEYHIVFCESKALASFLAFSGAIALIVDILLRGTLQIRGNLMIILPYFSGLFILLGIILFLYPRSCITVTNNNLIYRRGKIYWEVSWNEVEALYLSKDSFHEQCLQIKTRSGFTRLISMKTIKREDNKTLKPFPFLSLDYIEHAEKLVSYKNKDAEELIRLLKKLSGKQIEMRNPKGWEKIRE